MVASSLSSFDSAIDEASNVEDDEFGETEETSGCWEKYFPDGFWNEWKQLAKLAIPIMFTGVINYLLAPVTLFFVGKLGSTKLAALGLSRSIFHVAGLSILLGLLTTCETFFSQTFGGTNHFRLGVQVQRAGVILIICCLPCWAIYIIIEPILLASNQSPLISKYVSELMLAMIPALLFQTIYEISNRYVQSQNKTWPPVVAAICGNLVNAAAQYVLLFQTNVGIVGAAIAQSLAYFTQSAIVIGYIYFSGMYKTTWDGVHVELWHDWGLWFRLGIPGMMMNGLEWWACESGSLLSGLRGEKVLAIQTILNNIESIIYCAIPLGLSVATSLRIGHLLGANKAQGPRSTACVAIVTIICSSVVTMILILATRYHIPKIFTSDPEIISGAAQGLLSIMCFQYFNSLFGVCAAILRGAGLQKKGALVTCFSMYLVGAPIGLCLLLLTDLTVSGFWFGISIGSFISIVCYIVFISRIDWNKMCEDAKKRTIIRFVERQQNEAEDSVDHDDDTNDGDAKANTNFGVKACTTKLILNRSLLIGTFVCMLLAAIICRLTINLPDYFQNYCFLANETLVAIPRKPPNTELGDLECIRYLP